MAWVNIRGSGIFGGIDLIAPVNIAPSATATSAIAFRSPGSTVPGGTPFQTLFLSSLIGTGTFHVADITLTTRSGGGAGATAELPISWNMNSPVDSVVSVFNFNAVPEPSSAAFAGASGLLMLAAVRFSKRRRG